MDTKSTHKLTKYNAKQLARQLDMLVQQVADRGVYVPVQNPQGYYDVVDYLRNEIMIADVPTHQLANHLSTALNQRRHFSPSYLQTQLDRFHKLSVDCEYYQHTALTSTDEFKVQLAQIRLDDAKMQIRMLSNDLVKSI